MKLAIIIPVLGQHDLARTTWDFAVANLENPTTTDVIIIDNASDEQFEYKNENLPKPLHVVQLRQNIGVYPIFWEALKHTDADILIFIHSDLIIAEKGYDQRILKAFEDNPKLGMLGFIGSNEIDSAGGRGVGTTSNFQGNKTERHLATGQVLSWVGSRAEAHGMRNDGLTPAAVVDGCAMVFRREVLEKIQQRPDFPIHHFYDRLLSSETREAGYDMAVLGIACDHISGQTVGHEGAYDDAAREWAEAHGLTLEGSHNWDTVIYKEAERQWINEYRDIKHLVPCKV
jgi:GT2 family glycosyltransferase